MYDLEDEVSKEIVALYFVENEPIKNIAARLKVSENECGRIIALYRRDHVTNILHKAYYKEPEVGFPVMYEGKIYYDYTDYFLDRPCLYKDPPAWKAQLGKRKRAFVLSEEN